jgi:hypothetical protein
MPELGRLPTNPDLTLAVPQYDSAVLEELDAIGSCADWLFL